MKHIIEVININWVFMAWPHFVKEHCAIKVYQLVNQEIKAGNRKLDSAREQIKIIKPGNLNAKLSKWIKLNSVCKDYKINNFWKLIYQRDLPDNHLRQTISVHVVVNYDKNNPSQKSKQHDLYKIIKMNQIKFDVQKYCYPMVLKMNLESANLNLHVWTASSWAKKSLDWNFIFTLKYYLVYTVSIL